MEQKEIVDKFSNLYYDSPATWRNTYWMGIQTFKCPMDLWIYQEIICGVEPDIIIESGTYKGGSALYMAILCDYMKRGQIKTIDTFQQEGRPVHPRIEYIHGSSASEETLRRVKEKIKPSDKVLVILDSDHSKDHVLKEMVLYAPLVTVGSYMIVEDSNLNNNPVSAKFGPGPMEALREFLKTDTRFEIDKNCEKFLMTFNPSGYLKKVRS